MLHQLQIHRKILYSLATQFLEPMHGAFERLSFLAGLRNPSTGCYSLEPLGSVYGEEAVNQALGTAHEETFEGLLEMPLAAQEQDLRSFADRSEPAAGRLKERAERWIPPDSPGYLKDLFRANIAALSELLLTPPPGVHSDRK